MSSLPTLHFDEIIIVLVHDDPLQIMDKIPARALARKRRAKGEECKMKKEYGRQAYFFVGTHPCQG